MGSSQVKVKPLPPKSPDLTEKDYKFLSEHTGLSRADIKAIFIEFNVRNPDGRLDKNEFIRLYDVLRPEPPEMLNEISKYAFKCFDMDKNGWISFNEFLLSYGLTSRGDLKRKLDFCFDMYDSDNSQYLDHLELEGVLHAMLDLLGAPEKGHDVTKLSQLIMKELDQSKDSKISKAEFVEGLLRNYHLRVLLNPFN